VDEALFSSSFSQVTSSPPLFFKDLLFFDSSSRRILAGIPFSPSTLNLRFDHPPSFFPHRFFLFVEFLVLHPDFFLGVGFSFVLTNPASGRGGVLAF